MVNIALSIESREKLIPKERVAYVIKDKLFGEFSVKKSANAWYLNRGKVERLIEAFKYGVTIELACISIGISVDQYKYFKELHPEFSTIMEACRQIPKLRAVKTIVDALGTDVATARWYAERKMPEDFGKIDPSTRPALDMAKRMAAIRIEYQK
ncbi:MAG: hypothetical protein AAB447_03310 [Patescibacteria group bacterium]